MGLTTLSTIVSVQNQYPGFSQVETVTVNVANTNGFAVNQGVIALQVNGQTVFAEVHNGVAVASVATSFLDFGALLELFLPHPLTTGYSDSSGVFASSSAGLTAPAILLDYFLTLLALETQQLNQLQA